MKRTGIVTMGDVVERMKSLEDTVRFYADPEIWPKEALEDKGEQARLSLELE